MILSPVSMFRREATLAAAAGLLLAVPGLPGGAEEPAAPAEADFYRAVPIACPEDIKMEVSGLATRPDGALVIAVRKGEIWVARGPGLTAEDGTGATFERFASGLHEPLGLAWREGSAYVVQRAELTRLTDRDGDGEADDYEAFATGWGVTGNYHEYAYGPAFDRLGNAWITLNCTLGKGVDPADNAWRGWALRVAPDGSWTPAAGGMRSPAGVGVNAAGDAFFSDQQGNWVPACSLHHLREGAFYGHADALAFCDRPGATFARPPKLHEGATVVEAARAIAPLRLPAVWFPYRKVAMSTTDIVLDDTGGRLGPFAGQLFVGEFTTSALTRVFLEKVDGEYQGACFRFRRDFDCAVVRMATARPPARSLFVGHTNRGWNSLGTRSYGLSRLDWTGRTPFEIREMRARHNGFRLIFTRPANPVAARDPESYSMESYTYRHHARYGSPEVDREKVPITAVEVAPDGAWAELTCEGLREGYVHELRATGLRSAQGEPLLHPEAYYTLNRRPGAGGRKHDR